jgi:putative chitinase
MAKNNGNVTDGDGLKYIGRGFIQLTWRSNYCAAGTALNLDLEKNPDSAAEMENAIRIAAWYWKSRSLNSYTEEDTEDNFKLVTQKINPGRAGLADRQAYYKKAKATLGLEAV